MSKTTNEHAVTRRWVTKYALTKGIYEVFATLKRGYTTQVNADGSHDWRGYSRKTGAHDFETLEEAMVDAEKKRYAKIKRLKRQLKHLESMDIEVLSLDAQGDS